MELRPLGQSGLMVPPLCFGCNVFGWTVDEPTGFQLLDACLDAGVNFLDTADAYSAWAPGNSGGESETVIGNWLGKRGNRDKVIIATKVGWDLGPDRKGLAKPYILKTVEESLTRLKTDYIDLYQSHKDDPNVPQEETLEAYARLVEQGKVRVIGASNFSSDRLEASLRLSEERSLPRYESMQPRYNLYDREDYEKDLEPLCLKEKIGVITYSSLASGFLSGKYRTEVDLGKSPRGGRAKEKFNERGYRILDTLDRVSRENGVTPTAVALTWLMARPSVTSAIVSATSHTQLSEVLAAGRLRLAESELRLLSDRSA